VCNVGVCLCDAARLGRVYVCECVDKVNMLAGQVKIVVGSVMPIHGISNSRTCGEQGQFVGTRAELWQAGL
jgi:hypothetical protein